MASDAAPLCCAPGLAPGGISPQVLVSAELRGLFACPLLVIYRCFHLTHGSFAGPFSKNLILKWCKTGEKGKGKILVYVKMGRPVINGLKTLEKILLIPQHSA